MGRAPDHDAVRNSAALRSVPWQRRHRGSWAPAFAGETKGARTRASCRRKARCAEVRAVAAAPPRLLGPRFRGGNEEGARGKLILVFPANAGSQGPRDAGWQPRGHRTAKGSEARSVLVFKRTRASCCRKAHCAEVRSAAAAPPRFLGPRVRGGNEGGENPSIVLAESPLH